MLPISCVFYIIQDGARNILIDVGCTDGGRFVMSCFCRPTDLLKEYGVSPEEITDVVITHNHYDHIEAVRAYTNAVIYFCGDECYVEECFERRIPTGSSCNPEISRQFILEYGNSRYKKLLFHDPGILRGKIGFALQ